MKNYLKIAAVVLLFTGCITIIQSCKKNPTLPVLTTADITAITQTSAVSGGKITDGGGADISARGICWATTQNPTTSSGKTSDGTGTGDFISNITGLKANTTYYVRAYATNSQGTSYGNELSFNTSQISPATLTTSIIGSLTSSSAISGGNITADGGGTITARGVCWSLSQNPSLSDSKTTDGTGTGSFASNITGLQPLTTYYVRAYATNIAGTAYGNELSFATTALADADGNIYTSVSIGSQVWMVENLQTTKYSDNTAIPNITTELFVTTPGYSWYNNDEGNKTTYGALYNWHAVNTGKICPAGWHVPTDPEWTALVTFLGGDDIAGGKLKEAGSSHWFDPNIGTNESGFTALPGGYRLDGGSYSNMLYSGRYWSSTNYVPGPGEIESAYGRELNYAVTTIVRGNIVKECSSSVRCLRD